MRSGRARWSDLLVGVVLVLLIGTFAMAQINRARETANRVKCASNLRQIGQAMLLYSNDNRGSYPRTTTDVVFKPVGNAPLPPDKEPVPTWGTPYEGNDKLAAEPDRKKVDAFHPDKSAVCPKVNDVTAAMYLLLSTQDIMTGEFVCPSTGIAPMKFGGGKLGPLNWTNWQGNKGIADHLSYSVQNPYVSRAAVAKGFRYNNALTAEFALAADMNPGVDAVTKLNVNSAPDELRKANSVNHGSDGQNILFADGHVEWTSNPFVGMKQDNIYSFGPSGQDVKEKGGDGIVGASTGAGDSILLPTAKDVGVIDANGDFTVAAKQARDRVIEANRPATPAEQDASRKKLLGTYTRGGDTLTLTADQLQLTGATAATYKLKLAGIDRTKAQLYLLAADDPANLKGTIQVQFTANGIQVAGVSELEGDWVKK